MGYNAEESKFDEQPFSFPLVGTSPAMAKSHALHLQGEAPEMTFLKAFLEQLPNTIDAESKLMAGFPSHMHQEFKENLNCGHGLPLSQVIVEEGERLDSMEEKTAEEDDDRAMDCSSCSDQTPLQELEDESYAISSTEESHTEREKEEALYVSDTDSDSDENGQQSFHILNKQTAGTKPEGGSMDEREMPFFLGDIDDSESLSAAGEEEEEVPQTLFLVPLSDVPDTESIDTRQNKSGTENTTNTFVERNISFQSHACVPEARDGLLRDSGPVGAPEVVFLKVMSQSISEELELLAGFPGNMMEEFKEQYESSSSIFSQQPNNTAPMQPVRKRSHDAAEGTTATTMFEETKQMEFEMDSRREIVSDNDEMGLEERSFHEYPGDATGAFPTFCGVSSSSCVCVDDMEAYYSMIRFPLMTIPEEDEEGS